MAVKRPRRHILIQGFQLSQDSASLDSRTEVSVLDPETKQFVCCTSHQLFHAILKSRQDHGDVASVENADLIPFCIHYMV